MRRWTWSCGASTSRRACRHRIAHGAEPAEFALKADLATAGGLIAQLLELPGLPPVTARLDGAGPAADWRGQLTAAAGDASLDVDLGIGYGETLSWPPTAGCGPGGRCQAGTDLLPPAMETSVRVQWQPGHRLAIDRFKLESTEAQADISGVADLAAGHVQAAVDLRVSNAARWQRWFAPLQLGAARLTGSLAGPLERPQLRAVGGGGNLVLPEAAAQRARLGASGSVGIQDLHLLTDLSLTADGGFEGLALPAASLGGNDRPWPDLVGERLGRSQDGDLQIEVLNLKGGKAQIGVRFAGRVRAQHRRVADGEIADFAPLARLAESRATGAASCASSCSARRPRRSG